MTPDELVSKYQLSKESILKRLETLEKSLKNNSNYIWSGDLTNPYIYEAVCIGQDMGILNTEYTEQSQESGYFITWPSDSQNKINALRNYAGKM